MIRKSAEKEKVKFSHPTVINDKFLLNFLFFLFGFRFIGKTGLFIFFYVENKFKMNL
jgi:hypothetical protein